MRNSKLILDEDTMKFFSELKTLREKAGLTREETAQIIGVTTDTIAHYEAGSRPPSAKVFVQLATLFKYDISKNLNYLFYSGKVDYSKIKAQMRKLNLTRSSLAELTKYSVQSIYVALNRHMDSSPACLKAVMNALEIQV